jgi:hypothetical protein
MSDIELYGMKDVNPESQLISKEENNPCIDCPYDSIVFKNDKTVQDFCHYDCEAPYGV